MLPLSTNVFSMCSSFIAQVIQTTVNAKWNRIFCKIILALPFSFCNIILVFWSLISFYRLYLVKRAGK